MEGVPEQILIGIEQTFTPSKQGSLTLVKPYFAGLAITASMSE